MEKSKELNLRTDAYSRANICRFGLILKRDTFLHYSYADRNDYEEVEN